MVFCIARAQASEYCEGATKGEVKSRDLQVFEALSSKRDDQGEQNVAVPEDNE